MSTLARVSVFKDLLRPSGFGPEELVAFQTKLLRRLVAHAYDNVPYYRGLFDRSGVKPSDIRTLADVSAIPVTSKADIVDLPPEDVLARGADPTRLIVRRTSGSSGAMLTMFQSRLDEAFREAIRLRVDRYYGQRMTDTVANIVVDPYTPGFRRTVTRIAGTLKMYRPFLLNPLLPPEELVAALVRIRPDVIRGLSGVLARAAPYVDDEARESIRPRYVTTGGEVLTPGMKRRISEAFRAPVYDKYASYELGQIAFECKETGELHACGDNAIVEVLKDGRPAASGERGEVVVTNLHFHTMPFIRYRLEDVVTKGHERCPCGAPYPTIRAIQGRMVDFFHLPDGRVLHPYLLGAPVGGAVDLIREFQFIQEREDLIVANIVVTKRPSEGEIVGIKHALVPLLGEQVELRINLVETIDWGPSGKCRLFRSNVKSEYEGIDWDKC